MFVKHPLKMRGKNTKRFRAFFDIFAACLSPLGGAGVESNLQLHISIHICLIIDDFFAQD